MIIDISSLPIAIPSLYVAIIVFANVCTLIDYVTMPKDEKTDNI